MTASQQRRADRARLADVNHVLHGSEGSGAVQRVLYAVYVLALLALSYGFTVARALFMASDPQWVRQRLLGPGAAVVAVLLALALALLVHGVGRRRGPVVPPLPWVDHVVAGPLDRAVTLREWWLVSATLVVAGCAVIGGVVGGGLWASGTTGPGALVTAVVAGVGFGVVLAGVWLAGQLTGGDAGFAAPSRRAPWRVVRPSSALRSLPLPALRAQSIRSTRLGGAVLAGDLRAARLESATPVRGGRRLRLRSRGRHLTVVARDLLGLRRQPGLLVSGLLLVVPGTVGVAWALCEPEVPGPLAVLAVTATYLGIGVWAEGLRLLGDTLGTPALSGLGHEAEAAAHTVLPASLALAVGVPATLVVHALVPGTAVAVSAAVSWQVGVVVLVLGAHWVTAFRGRPPFLAFLPEVGPFVMTLWFARSLVWCVLVGGLSTAWAADAGVLGSPAVLMLGAVGLTWLWGRRALRSAAFEHRV